MLQQLRSRSGWVWAIVFLFFVVGFLLADTSGLLGLGPAPITNSTVVAKVNGQETVSYTHLDVYKRQLITVGPQAAD